MSASIAYRAACRPIEIVSRQGRMAAVVSCSTCPECGEWNLATRLPPPEQLARHFTRGGWDLRKKPRCPECSTPKKTEPKEPEMTASNVTAIKTTPEPSDAARKAKRLIYMALEDYYDDHAKSYRPGHSDETIARETGASVDFVKSIREADFGPLAKPSELAEIEDRIAAAEAAFGQALKTCTDTMTKIREDLSRLIQRNGWR